MEANWQGGASGNDGRKPWDLILRAVGAITAGIGALGFVTLAGGLVLFERFDGVGLPAEHAVAVVPRTDLLAVGASSLVPLAVLVGVMVLVLWVLLEAFESTQENGGQPAPGTPQGGEGPKPGSSAPDGHPGLVTEVSTVRGLRRVAAVGLSGAGGTLAYIFLSAGKHVSHVGNIIFLAGIVFGAALLWVLGWYGLSRYVRQHEMTPLSRFGWFTVLVSALVFVVAGLVNWVETREVPLVRPAVLETTTHTMVEGLFIADASDGVYIGEVGVKSADSGVGVRDTGRMLHFARDEVLGLSVGTNQSFPSARTQWRKLAAELKSTLPQQPESRS